MGTEFLADAELYERVVMGMVPSARRYVWIATADLKDLHVAAAGGRMVPFLAVLAALLEAGVEVRLVHAKEPGPNFRRDFDRYPLLARRLERLLCPRCHFKCVVVDGLRAYLGSANLTGAGLGARSAGRRNFEMGVVTDEPERVRWVMERFDGLWMGRFCRGCGLREECPEPADEAG